MAVDFASVKISFFVHSTEDETRLEKDVTAAFALHPGEITFDSVQGHFGNKMLFAKVHLTGNRAEKVSEAIFERLSQRAKSQLNDEIGRSVDEHDALYLRVDRQSLAKDFDLSDEEPLRVKLKPKIRAGGHEAMLDLYRKVLK
jgi:RNA binding exosome subunit